MNVPWSIFVVSLRVEQRSYLQHHFNQHMPIDLCVLDNTETPHCKKQWDSCAFKDLLDGVLDVCEEGNKQFVFLALVGLDDFIQLQNSFKGMFPDVKRHFFAALHYQCEVPYTGAIQYFTVLAFLSASQVFEGYSDSLAVGEQSMVLDARILDFEDADLQGLTDAVYLRVKKKLLIRQCIQKYCKEECLLLDLFSDGFVSEEGMQKERKLICLVENVEEQKALSNKLLQIARSHKHITEWAGLVEESSEGRTKASMDGKPQAEKSFDDTFDEILEREQSMC